MALMITSFRSRKLRGRIQTALDNEEEASLLELEAFCLEWQ